MGQLLRRSDATRDSIVETIAPWETGPKLVAQADLAGIETAAPRGMSR